MEQTIGRRISENRKRLGLTQDALAEKLGVTAQAVSKWENDQSCPDISMLPKLAEIFGISTDELLGHATQTVHEAEVVSEDCEMEGVHFHIGDDKKDSWEFHLDSDKHGAVAFAILVLLVGGLCLADVFYQWKANFWDILWPSALLVFGIQGLFKKFSFFNLGCGLFGIYFLVQNLGLWTLDIGGELVFPIILVLLGISLLVDALRKPNKPKFHISRNGVKLCDENGSENGQSTCSTTNDTFECIHAFGENRFHIALSQLHHGDVTCSFGELTVDLSGCETVSQGCVVEASCAFGQLTLLVPKNFRMETDSSTTFASIEITGQPDSIPQGIIRLDANASFGEILIKYV